MAYTYKSSAASRLLSSFSVNWCYKIAHYSHMKKTVKKTQVEGGISSSSYLFQLELLSKENEVFKERGKTKVIGRLL